MKKQYSSDWARDERNVMKNQSKLYRNSEKDRGDPELLLSPGKSRWPAFVFCKPPSCLSRKLLKLIFVSRISYKTIKSLKFQ